MKTVTVTSMSVLQHMHLNKMYIVSPLHPISSVWDLLLIWEGCHLKRPEEKRLSAVNNKYAEVTLAFDDCSKCYQKIQYILYYHRYMVKILILFTLFILNTMVGALQH